MKRTVIAFAVIGALAAPLLALSPDYPIIDNDYIYIWRDPFGDAHDHYAEVERGETISLTIVVNDLHESWDIEPEPDEQLYYQRWECAANGAITSTWWDPNVVDWSSVHEDKTGTYYSSYWGSTGNSQHLYNYWEKEYDEWSQTGERWVANDRDVIHMVYTIREDAPFGPTYLGLEQLFKWGYSWFFRNRIDMDDPWAMELVVVPPVPLGSFDGDQDVDDVDIDLLCDFIRNSTPYDILYDISADGTTEGTDGFVDALDLDYLIRFLVETSLGSGTEYGDFNLDGLIDTTDLTRLATNFGDDDWKWDDGNANRHIDTNIDNTDLTILATYFGFGVPDVVPEPMTLFVMGCGAIGLLRRRQRA